MSAGSISYYFTLFKKFQVLNHVPEQSVHGDPSNPQGGFNLNIPNSVFGSSDLGNLLGATTTPSDSPLWAILNSRASGHTFPTPVTVAGTPWPTMPVGSGIVPASWNAFQLTAPVPIVTVFGNWITAGKVNDIPSGVVNPASGVIANVPASIAAPLDTGVSLFACSYANDPGGGPNRVVPSNYWATSLIYLVDPATGASASLPGGTLNPGDEWFLVGVVGNRGSADAGEYLSTTTVPGVECAGIAMVWNTMDSPGVELPALSNLDVTDTNPIYDSYIMRSASYDVVGFRLNVQNVFDGIVAALTLAVANNQINLGALTPAQWVLDQSTGAHLCAKIVIRPKGGAFPNVGDSPVTNAAVAQKNLAPFNLGITVSSTNPTNIMWKNFVTGTPYFLIRPKGGLGRLGFVLRVPDGVVKLHLGIPTVTFERYFRKGPGRIAGFREIPDKELRASPHGQRAKPFPEAVVLEYLGGEHVIEIPPLPEKHYLGMAVGIEYQQHKLKPGPVGEIDLVHRAELPVVKKGTRTIEEQIVGGFTLQLRAVEERKTKT
jgi:hypothetical protein